MNRLLIFFAFLATLVLKVSFIQAQDNLEGEIKAHLGTPKHSLQQIYHQRMQSIVY